MKTLLTLTCLSTAGLCLLANKLPRAVDAVAPPENPQAVADGLDYLTGKTLLRQLQELEGKRTPALIRADLLDPLPSPSPEVLEAPTPVSVPAPGIVEAWMTPQGYVLARKTDGLTYRLLASGEWVAVEQDTFAATEPHN